MTLIHRTPAGFNIERLWRSSLGYPPHPPFPGVVGGYGYSTLTGLNKLMPNVNAAALPSKEVVIDHLSVL